MHKDVTKEIIRKLQPTGEVPWRFFEISESGKLVAENVDVEDYKGFTALQHATYENLPEVLKALIEAKVDINERTRHGITALHIAALENHLEIGEILIDAGANIHAQNVYENTPLDSAYDMGHMEFVEMIQRKCEMGFSLFN